MAGYVCPTTQSHVEAYVWMSLLKSVFRNCYTNLDKGLHEGQVHISLHGDLKISQ